MKLYKITNYNSSKFRHVLCTSMQVAGETAKQWTKNDPLEYSKVECLDNLDVIVVPEEKQA